jgi:hypothetical protein
LSIAQPWISLIGTAALARERQPSQRMIVAFDLVRYRHLAGAALSLPLGARRCV